MTDAVVYVPDSPPDIVPESMVLSQSKDSFFFKLVSPKPEGALEEVDPDADFEGAIKRGWSRMALQSLYFGPSDLLQPDESFEAIRGKLTVSPVLKVSDRSSFAPTYLPTWLATHVVCFPISLRSFAAPHFTALHCTAFSFSLSHLDHSPLPPTDARLSPGPPHHAAVGRLDLLRLGLHLHPSVPLYGARARIPAGASRRLRLCLCGPRHGRAPTVQVRRQARGGRAVCLTALWKGPRRPEKGRGAVGGARH